MPTLVGSLFPLALTASVLLSLLSLAVGYDGQATMSPLVSYTVGQRANNHSYAIVYARNITWWDALNKYQHIYNNMVGYLAVSAVNGYNPLVGWNDSVYVTIVQMLINDQYSWRWKTHNDFWLAGSDKDHPNYWTWRAGPLNGQGFYNRTEPKQTGDCLIPTATDGGCVYPWDITTDNTSPNPSLSSPNNYLQLRVFPNSNATLPFTEAFTWNDNINDPGDDNYTVTRGYIIEFGGMPLVQPVNITSDPNLPVNLTLAFDGHTPDHQVALKDFPQYTVKFDFQTLVERSTIDNSVVRSFSFDQLYLVRTPPNDTQNSNGNQNYNFVAPLPFGGNVSNLVPKVNVGFTLFAESTIITYAGQNWTMDPSTLKWSISIENWGMDSTSYLELDLAISTSEFANWTVETLTPTDPNSMLFALSSQGSEVVVELPTKVTLNFSDSNTTDMYKPPELNSTSLRFFFPYFAAELTYDPSLSILLGGGGGSSGSGSGSGGDGTVIGDGANTGSTTGSGGTSSDGSGSSGSTGGGGSSGSSGTSLIVGLTVGLVGGAGVVVLIGALIVAGTGAWFKYDLGRRLLGRAGGSTIGFDDL